MNSNMTIETILLGNFMKYDGMKRLTHEAFKDSNANSVNVYIDLYQMLIGLYKGVRIENYSIIVSTIINLCAHIRSYYRSRHRVETKIFLVYSTNNSNSNTNLYTDYNKTYKERINANQKIHDMVLSNIELLKIICPYLPDIFFLSGSFEPGVIMFDTILKQEARNNFDPNIIYSRSQYNYQLPAIHSNTVLFRVKKHGMEDSSTYANKKNVVQEYIKETRSIYYETIDIDSGLLSLLITLTNLPSRNIPSLFNINTAVNVLNQAIKNSNTFLNSYNSNIEYVYTILSSIKKIPISIEEFCNRFRAIDLIYQHMIYMTMPESKDETYLLNLEEPDVVRAINNEYFKQNPLDLNRL